MTESPRATPDQGSAELSDKRIRTVMFDVAATLPVTHPIASVVTVGQLGEFAVPFARAILATATQPAPSAEPTDLHAAIMNLPCSVPQGINPDQAYYFGRGHRDARHAAAELVATATHGAPTPAQADIAHQWREAYAAFKGAFDTPQMRRHMGDEYSEDARKRLRDFNEAFATQGEPTTAQAGHKPMQGLADWLRAIAETQAADTEQEAVMRQWAREVDAATGTAGDAGKTGEVDRG